MTISVFKKLIASTAIAAAPLLFPAVASANSAPIVNQEAVTLLTTSLRDTVQAYDSLQAGDKASARTKLSSAVQKLNSAASQDPTLGVSTQSGSAQNVNTLHNQLKAVHSRLNNGSLSEVRSELEQLLSDTGMI